MLHERERTLVFIETPRARVHLGPRRLGAAGAQPSSETAGAAGLRRGGSGARRSCLWRLAWGCMILTVNFFLHWMSLSSYGTPIRKGGAKCHLPPGDTRKGIGTCRARIGANPGSAGRGRGRLNLTGNCCFFFAIVGERSSILTKQCVLLNI